MAKLAKLASALNRRRASTAQNAAACPRLYLFTDQNRLADPTAVLSRLPRGAAIVLRHTDLAHLESLARHVTPRAHALGLKVLLAGDVRLALRLGCDGVHLSQRAARRGPPRVRGTKPGFIISAAAHDAFSLRRAAGSGAGAGADVVMLSPVFATASHVGARPLGPLRFARLAAMCARPVIALGGVTPTTAKRLGLGPAYGLAAINAWCA